MHEVTRREIIVSAAAAAALGLTGRLAFPRLARAQSAMGHAAMGQGFHRYRVGTIEVTALSDGVWEKAHDPNFIKNASVDETKAALMAAGLPHEFVPIPFTPNLVKTGDQLVLIDTGTGSGQTGGPKAGMLMKHLAAAGVEPGAINAILISHFHPDHIFGLMSKAPDNTPTFPNAAVHVPDAEFNFWMDPATERLPEARRPLAKRVQEMFPVLKDRLQTFAAGKEVVPGVRAVEAPGHTPGHTAFHVSSGSDQLLVLGDTTNIPALFARNPGWHAAFDQDAAMAEATRRRLFDRAIHEKAMVAGYHFPFPAVGTIVKDGTGYRFVPA
jgi:glyoxylase-like metal-dependent hydrolase (beta-lactamase superfamily II)